MQCLQRSVLKVEMLGSAGERERGAIDAPEGMDFYFRCYNRVRLERATVEEDAGKRRRSRESPQRRVLHLTFWAGSSG